jgi:dihydroorotate dehydrogenase
MASNVLYRSIIRPILFNFDPEFYHQQVMQIGRALSPILKLLLRAYPAGRQGPAVELFGLKFKNPIGLAAGFDKNVEAVELLSLLGFGHLELGTVTAQAQPGNPRPRVFRLPQDNALINRLGFPSDGVEVVAARLAAIKTKEYRPIIGVNIGKSKVVDIDDAAQDYLRTFSKVSSLVDYVAINVSSPNTPELRKLQEKGRLAMLLTEIQRANSSRKPILLKIAPDLTNPELDDVLDCALSAGLAGVIATNTTFSRDGIHTQINEQGGLSGRPLHRRSVEMVSYIYKRVGDKLPVIGCGGVFDAQSAKRMLDSGARLVQLYTALVYEGPFLVNQILKKLT